MIEKSYLKKVCPYKIVIKVLILLWFSSLLALVVFSHNKTSESIKRELGNKAMIVAVDLAERFDVDEREYNRLLSLNFRELLNDSVNIEFEQMTRNIMSYSDIKYIYILSNIPDSKAKYKVENGEEEIYGMPLGTLLNATYLLDGVASYDVRLEDTNWEWYTDKDRYTVMDEDTTIAYKSEKPGYFVSSSPWGNYLTGYAPVYLRDGKYIGIVGVDLYMSKYSSLIRNNLYIIIGFVLTNILIGLLTIYLSVRLKKVDKEMKEKIIISCTDWLTSTLNRCSFMEILETEWGKSIKDKKIMSLLFIDLDFFKQYNDNYGHLAGDENLRKISLLLNEKTEAYRGIVGRYSGDEFMILLPSLNKEKTEKLANEIIQGMKEINIKHEYSLINNYQTVSIGGVSILPNNRISIEDLIHYADTALYEAKKVGKNKAVIYDKIQV